MVFCPQSKMVDRTAADVTATKLWEWAIHPKSKDTNRVDCLLSRRWGPAISATRLMGHPGYRPRLLPGVTVPVTMLLWKAVTQATVEAFFVAWAEAHGWCPVLGCEPRNATTSLARRAMLPKPACTLCHHDQRSPWRRAHWAWDLRSLLASPRLASQSIGWLSTCRWGPHLELEPV